MCVCVCTHVHTYAGVVHRTCDLRSTSLSCPPVTTRQCKRVSTCVMAKPRPVPKCFSCKMHALCVCVCVCVWSACVFPALSVLFHIDERSSYLWALLGM